MRIDVITLFPEILRGPLDASILGRAQRGRQVEIALHQLRDYAIDKHHTVDDKPYGGGPGMLLKCEPIFAAVQDVQSKAAKPGRVILLSPGGAKFDQAKARELAGLERIVFLCGRTGPRASRRGGTLHRRFHPHQRRAGRAGRHRRRGAIAAQRRRQRSQHAERIVQRRTALDRRPAIHAARGISRLARAGDSPVGPSRQDRRMEPRAELASYGAGSARSSEGSRRRPCAGCSARQ